MLPTRFVSRINGRLNMIEIKGLFVTPDCDDSELNRLVDKYYKSADTPYLEFDDYISKWSDSVKYLTFEFVLKMPESVFKKLSDQHNFYSYVKSQGVYRCYAYVDSLLSLNKYCDDDELRQYINVMMNALKKLLPNIKR